MMAPSRASAACEGGGEASVGVVQAGLSSREILRFGVPTLFKGAEGNIAGGAIASRWWTPRGQRIRACTKISMRENRESRRSPALMPGAGRAGKALAVIP